MRRNAERMSWGPSNAGYTSLVHRPTYVACDLAYEQRGEPRWLRDTPRYDQRAKHLPRSSIIAFACFLHKTIVSASTPSYFLLCCVGGRAAWAGSSLLEIPSWPSSVVVVPLLLLLLSGLGVDCRFGESAAVGTAGGPVATGGDDAAGGADVACGIGACAVAAGGCGHGSDERCGTNCTAECCCGFSTAGWKYGCCCDAHGCGTCWDCDGPHCGTNGSSGCDVPHCCHGSICCRTAVCSSIGGGAVVGPIPLHARYN